MFRAFHIGHPVVLVYTVRLATLRQGMLFMAGQLGLDLPTTVLVSGRAALEMKQAIQNCETVAQAFSASVIRYCSSSVSLAQIREAEINSLVEVLGTTPRREQCCPDFANSVCPCTRLAQRSYCRGGALRTCASE